MTEIKRRLLEPHEFEIMVADEARRQFSRLPTQTKLKIRRDVHQNHQRAIEAAIVVAILMAVMVCVPSWHAPVALLLLIPTAARLRNRCLMARRAALTGLTPYCPKSVPTSLALGQLLGQVGQR